MNSGAPAGGLGALAPVKRQSGGPGSGLSLEGGTSILVTTGQQGICMGEREKIEVFDNPRLGREYRITIRCPEFTSVCPKTGQPDFGEITIEYCPDRTCIELKSLKFYMQGYRDKGIFYESLTNDILDDLSGVCQPRWMKVTARFTPRGGITTDVVAEYRADR